MGKWGGKDTQQALSWWTRWSHICMWINQEEQLGSKTDHTTQVPVWGNKASKPLAVKIYGIEAMGETPSLTGKFIGETHRDLECT